MSENTFAPSLLPGLSKYPESSEFPLSPELPDFLSSATGPVTVRMTNDYLFRALLQSSNKALKGLIGSLLHLRPDEILSAEITNPIILGTSVDEKDFILDIKVFLNNRIILNLELQVINQHNWPERSLSYLCRSFDNLNSGDDYQQVKPAIHIGLLDFTLFEDYPEFYATYMMMNVKNYMVYSDKLRLSVIDLTHIDLATEEDKRYRIDQWATLFKATTWEEIKMIAQQNEDILAAGNAIYRLTREERIRQICEAREDYYRCQRGVQRIMEEQIAALSKQEATLKEQETALKEQEATLKEQETALKEQETALKEQETALKEQENTIKEQEIALKERGDSLAEKDALIASLLAEKERLEKRLAAEESSASS